MTTIMIETDVMVAMRDSVRLATDIYRPASGGPTPVLLARTPYDKARVVAVSDELDILRAVRAGYTAVIQDTRGRFGSEGSFDAFAQEADDGADTMAWITAQPWSSGDVGTFGKSYLGSTQWLPARESPPALRAMAPSMTPSDIYEGNTHHGGANVLHGLRWAASLASDEARRRARQGHPVPEEWARDLDPDAVLSHLPLDDHPAYHELAPFWPQWLGHPTDGPYWRAMSPNATYDRISVPALNIGGWYDILLASALENYTGMRQRGGSATARHGQRLLVGPWSHTNFTGSFPEREFGPAASRDAIDLDGVQLRWFDHWLKGQPNGVDTDAPVTIFVMGANTWRSESDWPLPDTTYRAYFLHSQGQANTLSGDGTLSTRRPDTEPDDVYLYNPSRPVPTVGGQALLPGANSNGPRDQRLVEKRDDVLVYTTPVLERPTEVTGPVEVRLFVTSSAPDTDFTGKLVDVFPDGRAMTLTEGILRARYRSSLQHPELMTPGDIYELRVDLWATANVFQPGHRIRLEVSSSNFPRFGRNSNTGGDIAREPAEQYRTAVNRVLHDAVHPSRLIVPIIDR